MSASENNVRAKRVVERVLEYLAAMHSNRHGIIEWQSDNPVALARFIREGIKHSREIEEYSKYMDLINVYKIRIIGTSKVVAEPRLLASGYRVPVAKDNVQIFSESTNAQSVIGAVISNNRPSRAKFPNFVPNFTQLILVNRWCELQNPRYYLINHDEAGITLTTIDPGELKWTPPSEQIKSTSPMPSEAIDMKTPQSSGSGSM